MQPITLIYFTAVLIDSLYKYIIIRFCVALDKVAKRKKYFKSWLSLSLSFFFEPINCKYFV